MPKKCVKRTAQSAHQKKARARKTTAERTSEARDSRKAKFLAVYAEVGIVLEACKKANVGRRTVYDWLASDDAFAREFEEAREVATDVLEQECRRRATEGVEEPVFYQGTMVATVRKRSDTLLLALLNAYRPERFRQRHEITGKDGKPLMPSNVVLRYYPESMKPADQLPELPPPSDEPA